MADNSGILIFFLFVVGLLILENEERRNEIIRLIKKMLLSVDEDL